MNVARLLVYVFLVVPRNFITAEDCRAYVCDVNDSFGPVDEWQVCRESFRSTWTQVSYACSSFNKFLPKNCVCPVPKMLLNRFFGDDNCFHVFRLGSPYHGLCPFQCVKYNLMDSNLTKSHCLSDGGDAGREEKTWFKKGSIVLVKDTTTSANISTGTILHDNPPATKSPMVQHGTLNNMHKPEADNFHSTQTSSSYLPNHAVQDMSSNNASRAKFLKVSTGEGMKILSASAVQSSGNIIIIEARKSAVKHQTNRISPAPAESEQPSTTVGKTLVTLPQKTSEIPTVELTSTMAPKHHEIASTESERMSKCPHHDHCQRQSISAETEASLHSVTSPIHPKLFKAPTTQVTGDFVPSSESDAAVTQKQVFNSIISANSRLSQTTASLDTSLVTFTSISTPLNYENSVSPSPVTLDSHVEGKTKAQVKSDAITLSKSEATQSLEASSIGTRESTTIMESQGSDRSSVSEQTMAAKDTDEVVRMSFISRESTSMETTTQTNEIVSMSFGVSDSSPIKETMPTSESPLPECQLPCPSGYTEGADYCYRILVLEESSTYRKALINCQSDDLCDLADEVDLRNPTVMKLLKEISHLQIPVPERFYVKEYGIESTSEPKQVRIILLMNSTRFSLEVSEMANSTDLFDDVYGICKRSKYCKNMQCNLDEFEFYGTNNIALMPGTEKKLDVGQKIELPCKHDGKNSIVITCSERGNLNPHPTAVRCSFNVSDNVENSEVLLEGKLRKRKSCDECRKPGTKKCARTPDGAVCECHDNWAGSTCWQPPDQCEILQLQCGPNGICESEIDTAQCICNEGYAGKHCELNKANLSSLSPDKGSVLITSTGSVLILSTTQVLVMVLKGLLLIYFPTNGDDPQSFYQDLRPLVLMPAGFAALLFRQPTLFGISDLECGLWFYIITMCFSLAMAFYAVEAMNAYEVIKLEHANRWSVNCQGTRQWSLDLPVRTLIPIIAVNGVTLSTFAMYYGKISSRWSCMGNFSTEAVYSWFPIVTFNLCAVLIASDFSYSSFFLMKRVPQYQQKMDVYLGAHPDLRNNIKKCHRNILFTGIGPWLLFGLWLTQAISNDWVTVPKINTLATVFSFAYGLCSSVQTIVCSPELYSKFIWYAMRFLPERLSPVFDDVSLWTREEVLERYRKRKAIKSMPNDGQGYPICCPAHPDYLPIFKRELMRRQWTLAYAKIRMEHEEMTKSEVLYEVYMKELDNSLNYLPQGVCHHNSAGHLLKQWMSTIYSSDPQPDPEKKTVEQLERALESYCKLYENDPFEVCLVLTVNRNGNIARNQFCRTPIVKLDPKLWDELGESLGDTSLQNRGDSLRSALADSFDPHWMLTDEERRRAQMQEISDRVWEMANQNSDYLERSKALRR